MHDVATHERTPLCQRKHCQHGYEEQRGTKDSERLGRGESGQSHRGFHKQTLIAGGAPSAVRKILLYKLLDSLMKAPRAGKRIGCIGGFSYDRGGPDREAKNAIGTTTSQGDVRCTLMARCVQRSAVLPEEHWCLLGR